MKPETRTRGNCADCGIRFTRQDNRATLCRDCRADPARVTSEMRTCEFCSKKYQPASNRQRACRDCVPSQSWRAIYRRYGITKAQWDAMYQRQGGRCGICEQPLPANRRLICVDHCHTQGHVRELLCNICNGGLAFIENDKWMGRAFRYIERHRR